MASNNNTPFGLQPLQSAGDSYRPNTQVFYVAANTAAAFFLGDPVIKSAASADANGIDGVVLATAGSTNKITGIVVGFLGGNAGNFPGGSTGGFFANSGTPGPFYKATSAATAQYLLVETNPYALFVAQCSGNPASTVVGKNANLVSGNGSAYTGWSGWQVSATTGTSSSAQVSIVGFLQEVDNVIGSANSKLIVRLNQSTELSPATGV
jgi:hypothetical protein